MALFIVERVGTGFSVRPGENTLQAAASALTAEGWADAAALSAATAEAAAGPTYASTAAGLAATTSGDAFAVDAGGGLVSVYLNSSGTAVLQRTLATTAYLASSAGAGAVGFSHSATYAAGSLGAKGKQVVSVMDAPFNAKGDGITDDTAAIQAAIDAAGVSGGVVYLPAGIYLCAGLEINKSGVELRGETKSSTILKANAASDILTINATAGSVSDCGVRDIGFNPNGQSISGLTLTGNIENDFHVFERLEFLGAGNNTGFNRAVKVTGRMIWCRWQDIDIRYDRDTGFWCESNQSVNLNVFTNVRVWRSQKHGFWFNCTNASYWHSNSFYSCNAESNGVNLSTPKISGFYFTNVAEGVMTGAYVEDNGVGAIDGLSACVRMEGVFGGLNVTGGLFWGSNYAFKLDATLAWGCINGPRTACTTKNIEINATNSSSSFTVLGYYESTAPSGGRGLSSPVNVNADNFTATLMPLKMPLSSEQTSTLDLSNKSLLRYTNSSPVTLAAADLANAAPGHILWVVNDGSSTVTLTHSATLVVPGSANLTLNTSQSAMLTKLTAAKWAVLWWTQNLGGSYTVTNVTTDRAYDANATTLDEIADVLGTLISDLKNSNVIR